MWRFRQSWQSNSKLGQSSEVLFIDFGRGATRFGHKPGDSYVLCQTFYSPRALPCILSGREFCGQKPPFRADQETIEKVLEDWFGFLMRWGFGEGGRGEGRRRSVLAHRGQGDARGFLPMVSSALNKGPANAT